MAKQNYSLIVKVKVKIWMIIPNNGKQKNIKLSRRARLGWWCPRARRGTVIRFPDTRDHPISFSQSLAGFDSDDLVSAAQCFIHFDFGKGVWTFVSCFILYNSGKGAPSGHPRLKNIWEINSYFSVRCLMNGNLCRFYSSPSPTVGRKENKAGYKILQNKIQPGILRINSNRDCFEEISLSTTWCNHQYYKILVSHSK